MPSLFLPKGAILGIERITKETPMSILEHVELRGSYGTIHFLRPDEVSDDPTIGYAIIRLWRLERPTLFKRGIEKATEFVVYFRINPRPSPLTEEKKSQLTDHVTEAIHVAFDAMRDLYDGANVDVIYPVAR